MIASRADFEALREKYRAQLAAQKKQILVCGGSGCLANGSRQLYEEFISTAKSRGLDVDIELCDHVDHSEIVGVKMTGCHGLCELGPLVRIEPAGYLYLKCQVSDCAEIIDESIVHDNVVSRLVYHDNDRPYNRQEDIPFYKQQTCVTFEHCGRIGAESIGEYIAAGGYSALCKCVYDLGPDDIIAEISDSGLRGRGGAGYPTGKKWAQVASHTEAAVKYLVCNGDEGDPGAFMDRAIMEGDPHRVLEGMTIAGIACGCTEGRIYVRTSYTLAVKRLQKAIFEATELGILGDNVMGSGKAFRVELSFGAGAFVCGESSALTASIEGMRGMPRAKPPRTADKGLYGAPTVVNNVETLATVPVIISWGAERYSKLGTAGSKGTKTFALNGNINHTGLIEVPMGTTLREIVYNIGGGMKSGNFKAVQVGGPLGGCLTVEHLDIPLDFESTKRLGAFIGSGGLVVMNDDTCMVEMARYFISFAESESCGKCAVCRDGLPKMREILDRITHGQGQPEDLDMLSELSSTIKTCSMCSLGKNAPNALLSALKYFNSEYVAHVKDKKCPAGVCRSLCTMWIDPAKCIGCTKCARNCPVGAISGVLRRPHVIDTAKCIKCRECKIGCPKHAIKEV